MKNTCFCSRLLVICFLLSSLMLSTAATAASTDESLLVASSKKNAKTSGETPERIQKKLDEFAYNTICSINKCIIPSSGKKEISKNADGTFTARYIEIDVKSITTSYKKPTNPGPVSYIGYMNYEEIEYVCTAANKKDAAKGPFTPKRREMMTELVKYMKNKWTY